jgi:putative spermidine/putrescine transport system substrate-binding protein
MNAYRFGWSLTRRGLLRQAVGTSLIFGVSPFIKAAGAQAKQFDGKQIRVLTWSDATGQAAVRNIFKPFEEMSGAKVVADLTGTTSEMVAKIKASAAKPQYDVVILSGVGAYTLADAGLLEKPDLAKIPNLENVFRDYRTGASDHGIGYYLWSDGLLYNTKTYSVPPRSYKVLWEDSNSGKISIPPANNLLALELIIVANKIAGSDAMANADPGFEMLARLKDRVLTNSTNANQLADLFRTGSLNASGVYSPLEMSSFIPNPEYNVSGTYDLEEGFFVDLQFMVIPKGHPGDNDVVYGLINHALDPEVQGKMAEAVWYGPINEKAQLSDRARKSPYIPSPEVVKTRTIKVDNAKLAKVREDWMKRYVEAVGG